MSDPIQTAQDRAHAAIARLADAGHRAANEHAHALDRLRAEVEALRSHNKALRERVADLEHRCAHTAEVLVRPVDTEGPPVKEVVRGTFEGWPCMSAGGSVNRVDSGRWAWRGHGFDTHNPWHLCQNVDSAVEELVNEAAAIRWVLDGVLP
jgi:hypothetical protein